MSYDAGHETLAFHLRKTFDAPPRELDYDFADQLRGATRLAGLTPTAAVGAALDPGPLTLDLIFGAILARTAGSPLTSAVSGLRTW